jgi:hypothetical protein
MLAGLFLGAIGCAVESNNKCKTACIYYVPKVEPRNFDYSLWREKAGKITAVLMRQYRLLIATRRGF